MPDRTIEERVAALERSAHYHNVVERINCTPEAELLQVEMEKKNLDEKDAEKAKKSGSLFGDPIFSVE